MSLLGSIFNFFARKGTQNKETEIFARRMACISWGKDCKKYIEELSKMKDSISSACVVACKQYVVSHGKDWDDASSDLTTAYLKTQELIKWLTTENQNFVPPFGLDGINEVEQKRLYFIKELRLIQALALPSLQKVDSFNRSQNDDKLSSSVNEQ
jgi:hypothetical protein